MHFKNIKAIIRKQLKTNYRDWKRLKKREKREIAQKVLDEVLAEYDFKKEVETDKLESGVSTSLRSIQYIVFEAPALQPCPSTSVKDIYSLCSIAFRSPSWSVL
ncbi:MAG: hypothetical protein LJE96_07680, partial [Deltaproteobacteria bacterium]|nr:hypothetical protein [Deltaproteobacteria bacterium]